MEEKSKYLGVILAAGRGTRMGPFGKSYPKPILPICNKPLISYQIDIMRSMGIREIIVLIGHKGYEITKILGDGRQFGVKLRYEEQTRKLGIAHAIGCLEHCIDRPFMLFLGDVFFIPGDIQEMFDKFEEQGGGAVLATKIEHNTLAIRRNYAVHLSDDGYVTRVIEKPRHTTNKLKGVGLYVFDLAIFDAIRRTPRTAMRDEYEITESIQVLIDDQEPVRVANAIKQDLNVTTADDLLMANIHFALKNHGGKLIGTESCINDGVKIEDAVIGSNVTIRHPISIKRSVIFDGTELDSTLPIENSLVSPYMTVYCNGVI